MGDVNGANLVIEAFPTACIELDLCGVVPSTSLSASILPYGPHSSSSDSWSAGAAGVPKIAVLKARTAKRCDGVSGGSSFVLWSSPTKISELIENLRRDWDSDLEDSL